MSNITKARTEIMAAATRLRLKGEVGEAVKLENVVQGLMHRKSPARRASRHSKSVTGTIRKQVLHLASTTDLHSSEIAARLGINPGRVSEIINP